jgi:hypothetical protein
MSLVAFSALIVTSTVASSRSVGERHVNLWMRRLSICHGGIWPSRLWHEWIG